MALANIAVVEGYMSSTGRVSTKGELRYKADRAAQKERTRAEAAGSPYKGVVGHVPDTTWTGTAEPRFWMDLDSTINSSIGSQAQNYPIGYRPKRFIYEGDL